MDKEKVRTLLLNLDAVAEMRGMAIYESSPEKFMELENRAERIMEEIMEEVRK